MLSQIKAILDAGVVVAKRKHLYVAAKIRIYQRVYVLFDDKHVWRHWLLKLGLNGFILLTGNLFGPWPSAVCEHAWVDWNRLLRRAFDFIDVDNCFRPGARILGRQCDLSAPVALRRGWRFRLFSLRNIGWQLNRSNAVETWVLVSYPRVDFVLGLFMDLFALFKFWNKWCQVVLRGRLNSNQGHVLNEINLLRCLKPDVLWRHASHFWPPENLLPRSHLFPEPASQLGRLNLRVETKTSNCDTFHLSLVVSQCHFLSKIVRNLLPGILAEHHPAKLLHHLRLKHKVHCGYLFTQVCPHEARLEARLVNNLVQLHRLDVSRNCSEVLLVYSGTVKFQPGWVWFVSIVVSHSGLVPSFR